MRTSSLVCLGGAAVLATASHGGAAADGAANAKDRHTTVTIWRAPAAPPNPYGYGYPYGGYGYGGAATDGAFVAQRRDVEVAAEGELRFPGVSSQIDPSTVQFRSVTDPKGTTVVEQRYAYDLGSPEKLLKRYINKQITVTTSRGDITGTLRAVDSEALVIETGSGNARAVEIVRRGPSLLDIKLAAGDQQLATEPTLIWKVVSKKPGKQEVEVSYRTAGLRWDADYTATLDETKSAIDLSAWATIHNDTGVEFKHAELVLTTGILDQAQAQPPPQYGYGYVQRAPSAPPVSFTVPREVTVAASGTVQVELMPARTGMASRRVVVYETTLDQSPQWQYQPNQDCYTYVQPNTARGELALEVDTPTKGSVLPEGKIRVFKKKGDGVELLGEDNLKVNASTGAARLRLGTDEAVFGERRQVECKYDDRARTLREKVEVKVENKGKEPVEVILKEYMFRWVNWRIEAEDVTGTKAATQTQEYRVKLGANSKKTFTYTVQYSW
jgi:hypothetical protein